MEQLTRVEEPDCKTVDAGDMKYWLHTTLGRRICLVDSSPYQPRLN
jgi:hypothetical protein